MLSLQPLRIVRFKRCSSGVFGRLMYNNMVVCHTIEHNTRFIESGIYSLDYTYSPKFHINLPLILHPSRTGIRIHVANTMKDVAGCVGVGKFSDNKLIQSKFTLNCILPFIRDIKKIEIIDSFEND